MSRLPWINQPKECRTCGCPAVFGNLCEDCFWDMGKLMLQTTTPLTIDFKAMERARKAKAQEAKGATK